MMAFLSVIKFTLKCTLRSTTRSYRRKGSHRRRQCSMAWTWTPRPTFASLDVNSFSLRAFFFGYPRSVFLNSVTNEPHSYTCMCGLFTTGNVDMSSFFQTSTQYSSAVSSLLTLALWRWRGGVKMAPVYCARLGQLLKGKDRSLCSSFLIGGNGDGAGVVPSLFLLQVLR